MTTTIFLVIFVIVGSMLFPLAGYFLDWKHNKKMHMKDKKGAEKAISEKQ